MAAAPEGSAGVLEGRRAANAVAVGVDIAAEARPSVDPSGKGGARRVRIAARLPPAGALSGLASVAISALRAVWAVVTMPASAGAVGGYPVAATAGPQLDVPRPRATTQPMPVAGRALLGR